MSTMWLPPAPAAVTRHSPPWAPMGAVVAAQLAVGLVIGVLWRIWSPATSAFVIAGGSGQPVVIPDESESQIAGDGRFFVMVAVAGVLAAVLTWQVRRLRGVTGLAAVAVGAIGSSLVARAVGMLLATGHSSGSVNATIRLPLQLHASALITAQALAAVFVYVTIAGLSSRRELGADARPTGGVGPTADV